MRRFALLSVMLAGAPVASAQMPPSISKPIEQARKAAAATNAQTAVVNGGAKPATAATPQTKKPASAAKAPAKAPAASASATAASTAASRVDSSKITFDREVFAYVTDGRRDPFASPIETGEIRPLVADLKVVGIIFDPAGRNSVAVMRDMSTQQQYRAKTGQLLGRARVTQIKPQEVVLSIEEYGFSRQETLRLNVQQTQQTKGKP